MFVLITIAFFLEHYGTQALPLTAPIRAFSLFEAHISARDDPSEGCHES